MSMSRWPAIGCGVLGVGRQVGGLRQLQVVQKPGLLFLYTLHGGKRAEDGVRFGKCTNPQACFLDMPCKHAVSFCGSVQIKMDCSVALLTRSDPSP